MSKINEMRLGFETAYIDGSVVSSSTYRRLERRFRESYYQEVNGFII